MRLIDADKILNVLYEEKKREDCFGMWYTTVCSIIKLLESAPTVETSIYGYPTTELAVIADACRSAGIDKQDIHNFVANASNAYEYAAGTYCKQISEYIEQCLEKANQIPVTNDDISEVTDCAWK